MAKRSNPPPAASSQAVQATSLEDAGGAAEGTVAPEDRGEFLPVLWDAEFLATEVERWLDWERRCLRRGWTALAAAAAARAAWWAARINRA